MFFEGIYRTRPISSFDLTLTALTLLGTKSAQSENNRVIVSTLKSSKQRLCKCTRTQKTVRNTDKQKPR